MPTPRKGVVVMIVEDDLDCLEATGDALEYGGYDVISATNGEEALLRLKAGSSPALILVDLMMPVMDGGSFVRELRRDPSLARIPIALLSGERDLPRRATELGVEGCVLKPIALADLLAEVGRLLSLA